MGNKISYTKQAYSDIKKQTDAHISDKFALISRGDITQYFDTCGDDICRGFSDTQNFMDEVDECDTKKSRNLDKLYDKIGKADEKGGKHFEDIGKTIETIDNAIATLTQCISIDTSADIKTNVKNLKVESMIDDIEDAISSTKHSNVYQFYIDYDKLEKWLGKANDGSGIICGGLDSRYGLKMLKDGVRFRVRKRNGKYIVNVEGSAINGTGRMTWAELRRYLKENVKGVDWLKYDAKKLARDGIELGSRRAERYLSDMGDSLAGNIDMDKIFLSYAEHGRIKTGLRTFGREFLDGLNPKEYFNFAEEATKLGKLSKGLGIAGDAFTVISNAKDNIDKAGGIKNVNADVVQDIVTDSVVDVGSGVATAAAGAAIGSCFAPPVGTVVGAVAGLGIDAAANIGIADIDHDGKKDSLVGMAKIGIDNICDAVGSKIEKCFW